jgi:hypothetical protein
VRVVVLVEVESTVGRCGQESSARGRDANNDCPTGTDGSALDRLEGLIKADFNGGEIVIPAADSETLAGNFRVVHHEEVHDLVWRHGGLLAEGLEFLGDGDGFVSGAGGGEKCVGGESGAGAVSAPLVLKQALVGVDVLVGRGVGWAGCVGAILRIGAVVVLRPETVEDEGRVCGALGGVGVGMTKLRRPGEVEEIVVEA